MDEAEEFEEDEDEFESGYDEFTTDEEEFNPHSRKFKPEGLLMTYVNSNKVYAIHAHNNIFVNSLIIDNYIGYVVLLSMV